MVTKEQLKEKLKLYVILDRKLGNGVPLRQQAQLAIAGGATAIQLRDKEMKGRDYYQAALVIKDVCKENNVLFIVNDRLDVALAAEADGVHLGQEDLPLHAAKKLAPPGFIIGISAVNVEQAKLAEKGGADYLGVGDVFGTASKPDAKLTGVDMLKMICQSTSLPCVAIGGINVNNAKIVLNAGAIGIAVISAPPAGGDPVPGQRHQLPLSRRTSSGLDLNRVALVMAVLDKYTGTSFLGLDTFVNAVGGVKLTETAADLALALSLVSSLRGKGLPNESAIIGEVGLTGEIRPVNRIEARLKEGIKLGFRRFVVPRANLDQLEPGLRGKKGIAILGVSSINEAVESVF